MEYVTAQGAGIPAVGLGTWQLTGEKCVNAVRAALDLGYRLVDTAQAYGNEDDIGAALAGSGVDREELFVTTKVANTDHAYVDVLASTDHSLRRLGTDYIDLLLIHWPVDMDILPRTLEAMKSLQVRERVRFLGVSNFTPGQVRQAADIAEVVNVQVEHHPYLAQDELRALSVELDFSLTAYSPLARGRVLHDDTLIEIAESHGASPDQVALRYLHQLGRTVVIPKASSREHLERNLASLDLELHEDEMSRIAALDRGERLVNPSWAPAWNEA